MIGLTFKQNNGPVDFLGIETSNRRVGQVSLVPIRSNFTGGKQDNLEVVCQLPEAGINSCAPGLTGAPGPDQYCALYQYR